MPNHVTNHLYMQGSEGVFQSFLDKAKRIDHHGQPCEFTFNSFVPMPESILRGDLGMEEMDKPNNWYNWSRTHWGTKWDAYSITISDSMIEFDTAWSVPLPVLIAISEQFPEATVINEWIEEFTESAGIVTLQNGCIISDLHETGSAWNNMKSEFIHPLNLKYNKEDYIETLEACADDADESGDGENYCRYYLNLINSESSDSFAQSQEVLASYARQARFSRRIIN